MVVAQRAFEPFGEIATERSSEPTERAFGGQRFEESSGLYDFQARWYDPVAGRFLSVDPLVRSVFAPQSLNAYSYVENDPVNRIDPTGLEGENPDDIVVIGRRGQRDPPPSFPGVGSTGGGSGGGGRGGGGGAPGSAFSATAAMRVNANIENIEVIGKQISEPGLEGQLFFDPTDIFAGIVVGLIFGGGAGVGAFFLIKGASRLLARRAEKAALRAQGLPHARLPVVCQVGHCATPVPPLLVRRKPLDSLQRFPMSPIMHFTLPPPFL